MLAVYAERFDLLELNATFYATLSRRSMKRILEKADGRLTFAVKAHREISHGEDEGAWSSFRESIEPIKDSGVLGCVLVQFPFRFRNEEKNRGYVCRLKERASDVPLAVEFRHDSWLVDPVAPWLRKMNVAFCCVDEPELKGLMAPRSWVTSSLGYVRFHGRNEKTWLKHDEAWERYDYLYSSEELEEWIPRIRKMNREASQTFVLFNNHYRAQAIQNAQALKTLLEIPM